MLREGKNFTKDTMDALNDVEEEAMRMMIRRCCDDNPIVLELEGDDVETSFTLHSHPGPPNLQATLHFPQLHTLHTSPSHLFPHNRTISHLILFLTHTLSLTP